MLRQKIFERGKKQFWSLRQGPLSTGLL